MVTKIVQKGQRKKREIGVSHTSSIGLSHTLAIGVSHTDFEATGKYILTNLAMLGSGTFSA